MSLHQIATRKGGVDRVPDGQTPVVELYLQPNERIVSFELRESMFANPARKTIDWRWTAIIDVDLGEPLA